MTVIGRSNRKLHSFTWLVFLAMVCQMTSCSGKVGSTDQAVRKMIKAYGGPEKVKQLQTYSGKGFTKDISSRVIAKNYPFDIYKKGLMFKSKTTSIVKGRPVNLIITVFDGKELYQYSYGRGKKEVPAWELMVNMYKFPQILEFVQAEGIEGEVFYDAEKKGSCMLRYTNRDDIITLTLDGKTWLLQEMELKSKSDPSFQHSESYSDYRMVKGVPFPGRYIGRYKNQPYYEYLIPVIEYGVELPDSLFGILVEDTSYISKHAPQETEAAQE